MLNWLKKLFAKKPKSAPVKVIPPEVLAGSPVRTEPEPAKPYPALGTPDRYLLDYSKCEVMPSFKKSLDNAVAKIKLHQDEYRAVESATKVPWKVVAVIHWRESSLNFSTYLGNGQKLNQVTTIVPKGRGPFSSFSEGCIDALTLEGYAGKLDWSLATTLKRLEMFNGGGYLKRGMVSPYLFACSNMSPHKGYYIEDGKFHPEASCDEYLGCIPILKALT